MELLEFFHDCPMDIVKAVNGVFDKWERGASAPFFFVVFALRLVFLSLCFVVYLVTVLGLVFLCFWPFLRH